MSKLFRHLCALFLVLCLNYDHGKRSVSAESDILRWGWDRWCQLQPKVGDCNEEHKYYYYDTQTDACRQFSFSGCNGNENKFHTKNDCEEYCKGFGLVMAARSLTLIETCSLQPNPGTCVAYFPFYYFDVNTSKCKLFVFSGCGGNANRFATESECYKKCTNIGL